MQHFLRVFTFISFVSSAFRKCHLQEVFSYLIYLFNHSSTTLFCVINKHGIRIGSSTSSRSPRIAQDAGPSRAKLAQPALQQILHAGGLEADQDGIRQIQPRSNLPLTSDQKKVFNELHLLQRHHPSLRLHRSPLLHLLILQVRRNPLHKRVSVDLLGKYCSAVLRLHQLAL